MEQAPEDIIRSEQETAGPPGCKALEALQEIAKREGAYSRDPLTHAGNTIDNMERIARAAIRDHQDCDGTYETLWETLGRLFSWEDDPRGIPIGMWKAAYDAFKAAGSVDGCPGGPECPHYQEGHEAPREPAGRGTA